MHRTRMICAALLLMASAAYAGIENAGTTSANFLSVGTGASVLSMGGAALGTGGSLHAAAWNPAALGLLAGPQYSVSHASLAMQTSQDWVAAGGRLRNGTTRWSLNAIYENDGNFEGRDAFGASTGTFNASNLALGAHVARPFGQVFAFGAGLQWVNEYLGQVTGTGMGFDLGVQAHAGAFGVGAAARNMGGKVKFDSGDFAMPAVYGLGASWADPVRGLRFNLDANFPSAYYNDVRFGGEWMWQNRVALRGGYRKELNAPAGEPLGGPSFGMGAGSNSVWVDYGFLAGASEAQGAHRLSFSMHPGFMNPGGLAMAPTPVASREAPLAEARPAQPAAEPVAIVREEAKPVAEPVAIVREEAKPVAEPVAIVREVAKPAAVVMLPAPAPRLAPPVLSIVAASAPVVQTPAVHIDPPSDALAAQASPRATRPASAVLRPDKSARVPRLVIPKLEPVAVAKPAAPVRAAVALAPVAAAVVAPVTPVPVAAPRPAVQLASSAPAAPVVVPNQAPQSEPIARPSAQVVVAAPAPPPAPVARPSSVVVQANQSLADIAKQWGSSVAAIMMENNLVSERVKQGTKLKLPPAGRK